MKDINLNTIIRKSDNFVSSELDGELVMMSLENNSYYGLNEIGKRIFEMAEQAVKVEEITANLVSEYEVDLETCCNDVLSLLTDLQKEGLIVVD
jgi:hypothetical protein